VAGYRRRRCWDGRQCGSAAAPACAVAETGMEVVAAARSPFLQNTCQEEFIVNMGRICVYTERALVEMPRVRCTEFPRPTAEENADGTGGMNAT